MLVYLVSWSCLDDKDLTKGKGKVTMADNGYFFFTVLCRSSSDALRCLRYVFLQKYGANGIHGIQIDDGVTTLRRSKLDSRSLNIDYLFMDKMKEPMTLHDVMSNVLRLHSIFGV